MERDLDARLRIVELYDAYAALLTPKQRRLLRLYYLDDLSLGEIAGRLRITRQAVHDSLKRSMADLRRYESKLGVLSRRTRDARVRESLRSRLADLEREITGLDGGERVAGLVREIRSLGERL